MPSTIQAGQSAVGAGQPTRPGGRKGEGAGGTGTRARPPRPVGGRVCAPRPLHNGTLPSAHGLVCPTVLSSLRSAGAGARQPAGAPGLRRHQNCPLKAPAVTGEAQAVWTRT